MPEGTPAGHIAVTEYSEGAATIGAWIVNPAIRGGGVGMALLEQMLGTVQVVLPELADCITYAHEGSLPKFLQAGGQQVGEREVIPPAVCKYVVDLSPALRPSELEAVYET